MVIGEKKKRVEETFPCRRGSRLGGQWGARRSRRRAAFSCEQCRAARGVSRHAQESTNENETVLMRRRNE